MNLHNRIMNLPCAPRERDMLNFSEEATRAYKLGHRDARHAAAELANEADAVRDQMLAALKALVGRIDYEYARFAIAAVEKAQ